MSVSRRDALTFLLGSPLAFEACRAPRGKVDGEIRGGSLSIGHRLRELGPEALGLAQAGATSELFDVAIVGAGPSGLSAARELTRAGHQDYVVFDLEEQAGGTSSFGQDGVVPYPWGAHYVPLPTRANPALVELLDEMGVLAAGASSTPRAREEYLVRAPEERLFLDGAWRGGLFPFHGASSDDLRQYQQFGREIEAWVRWRDGRGQRAFTLPVAACSDDPEVTALDRISAEQWLAGRGLTSPRLRWYVEYACRDDYGLRLGQTSAWAMLFYFAARVPEVGKASQPFVAWPEGNGRIVRHLGKIAGGRIRTGQLVTDIVPGPDAVDFAVFEAHGDRLVRYRARHLILAVPKFVLGRIVRPFRENAGRRFADFTYSAWLVANLHLKQRPHSRGFPLSWDNVLYDSPSLGYVCATHQALRDRGPTVWTYYLPLLAEDPAAARRQLLALEHDEICDAIISDLKRAHPDLDDAITRIDAWRWGHAMIRPTPGFVWGRARREAAESMGRLVFAHSDLSGLALFEEAQYQGIRAAKEVLDAKRAAG